MSGGKKVEGEKAVDLNLVSQELVFPEDKAVGFFLPAHCLFIVVSEVLPKCPRPRTMLLPKALGFAMTEGTGFSGDRKPSRVNTRLVISEGTSLCVTNTDKTTIPPVFSLCGHRGCFDSLWGYL